MKLREKSPLWRRVVRLIGRQLFHAAENNDDPRPERNGEAWLLREVLASSAAAGDPARPRVIFDVGANVGDYTRLVLQAANAVGCPVDVHVFEPSPRCQEALQREFGGFAHVTRVSAAVADRAGEAVLHEGSSGSELASLVVRGSAAAGSSRDIRVPLIALQDYLETTGTGRVDFLKLDVEGSELAALRGLGDSLRPDVVDVIQFEYGGTAVDAGITLRDLYRLLQGRGYVMAKLFPTAVEVRSYRPWMEHYAYANFVALAPHWRRERDAAP